MKTDMSPKAVSTRLRRVSQLHRICRALSKSTPTSANQSPKTSPKNKDN